jgi:hypothetical protein
MKNFISKENRFFTLSVDKNRSSKSTLSAYVSIPKCIEAATLRSQDEA